MKEGILLKLLKNPTPKNKGFRHLVDLYHEKIYWIIRKMVMESFSNDQKKLIDRYDKRIDTIRKKFNKSLSKKQRILITKSKRKRSKKND